MTCDCHHPVHIAFVHKTCQQSFGCLNILSCMKKDKNMDETLFGKVYYKLRQLTLLQIATRGYYKMRQVRYYKLRQVLLQIAKGITNCDNRYYKLRHYYKLRQYKLSYLEDRIKETEMTNLLLSNCSSKHCCSWVGNYYDGKRQAAEIIVPLKLYVNE